MESLVETLRREYKLGNLPTYTHIHCANGASFGFECEKCAKLCPEGIFPVGRRDKRPNFAKCTRCGICSGVCPTAAISPIDTQTRNFMMALARSEELSAGCADDEEGWSVSYECLAALSWEQIACAALRNGITVSLRPCAECERRDCAAQIIETLSRAKKFLGDDLFFDKVNILESGDEYSPHGAEVSRRELFTFFKRLPLDAAVSMLPELKRGEQGALFYRALLRDLVREKYDAAPKESRPRYTVSLPHVTDDCNACRTCQRMCREKALNFKQTEDGTTLMTVDAYKCTACGVCAGFCTKKAIDGIADMSVPHLGTMLLKRIRKE